MGEGEYGCGCGCYEGGVKGGGGRGRRGGGGGSIIVFSVPQVSRLLGGGGKGTGKDFRVCGVGEKGKWWLQGILMCLPSWLWAGGDEPRGGGDRIGLRVCTGGHGVLRGETRGGSRDQLTARVDGGAPMSYRGGGPGLI